MLKEKDFISLGFKPRDAKYSYLGCQYYIDNGTDYILGISEFDKGKLTISIEHRYDYEGYNGLIFNINNLEELKNIINLIDYKI